MYIHVPGLQLLKSDYKGCEQVCKQVVTMSTEGSPTFGVDIDHRNLVSTD